MGKFKKVLFLLLCNLCNIQFQLYGYDRVEIFIEKGLKELEGSHTNQTIIAFLEEAW